MLDKAGIDPARGEIRVGDDARQEAEIGRHPNERGVGERAL